MRRRFICVLIFVSLVCFAYAEEKEYSISQKDIDEFLSFVDAYKLDAEQYVKNASVKSVSEIFYNSENEKWAVETESFLKKNNWSFDKMSRFLYTVSLSLLAIDYCETYGDALEREGGDLFEEIPATTKTLVKKNLAELTKYFPREDNARFAEESEEPPDSGQAGDATMESGEGLESKADLIRSEVTVAVKVTTEAAVTVAFDSSADELVLNMSIFKGSRELVKGQPKRVKPWTLKGGHVEYTWSLPKKDMPKGTYSANVTIMDKDGNVAAAKNTELRIE